MGADSPAKGPAESAGRVPGGAVRAFALLTAAVAAGIAVFFALYSLLPVTRPDAPELGSLFTGAMMAFVMAVQAFVPALVRRWSLRLVLVLALILLGVGALLSGSASGPALLMPGAALSGIGFGAIVVVGTQGVALFVPGASLGRALGVYGLVTLLASAFGSPAGVQLALVLSPEVFGVGAAALCAVSAAAASRLPAGAGREPGRAGVPGRVRAVPWRGRLSGVPIGVLAFLLVSVLLLSHGLSSFAVLGSDAAGAALAIFCVQLGNAIGRWLGGELERWLPAGVAWVLVAGCVAVAAAAGVLVPGLAAVVVCGLLLGAGIGAVQTVTLHAVLRRLEAGRASVVWNLTVDAGLWAGGVGWGIALSAGRAVPAVVTVSCVALLLGLVLAVRARRADVTGASRRRRMP
ncbi:MFS transporter [Leucobacter sp. gxy201]|uniref:MFS transporter n=1 Tax=Leucobacter sp. gxy201 TaxID=2957200 RepID=UPI003DA0E84D